MIKLSDIGEEERKKAHNVVDHIVWMQSQPADPALGLLAIDRILKGGGVGVSDRGVLNLGDPDSELNKEADRVFQQERRKLEQLIRDGFEVDHDEQKS